MKLSNRLQAIEDCLPTGCILADIGCDHAYLACDAIIQGKAIKSYAMDNKQGPLTSALATIRLYQLENTVFPILSNGLEKIAADANCLVVAGMGFETIKMICEADLSQFHTIVFQSNSDIEQLRRWANQKQLKIVNEKIVHEGHYYQVIAYQHGTEHLSDEDYLFGTKAMSEPLFKEYWNYRLSVLNTIYEQSKQVEIKQQIQTIQNKLKEEIK